MTAKKKTISGSGARGVDSRVAKAPAQGSLRSWASWALAVAALGSFASAFVHLGAMPFLDISLVTFATTAAVAAGTLSRDQLVRLLPWRVTLALGVFLAFALVSSLVSGRVFSALFGNPGNGWGWLALVGAASIVLAAASRRSSVRLILITLAPWLIFFEAVFATHQRVFLKMWPAGTFSNPTYLVFVLGVLLPLAATMPEGTSVALRRLRAASVVVGLVLVGISGARVGFVAVFIWVVWALWTGAMGGSLPGTWRRAALVVLGVLAVPAGIFSYRTGGVGVGEFLADRSARFSASWGAMVDRPLTGWGPDGFVNGGAAHATKALLKMVGSEFGQFGADPHNALAWFLASVGLVGTALIGWVLFEVVRNWRRQAKVGVLDSALVWGVCLFAFQALFAPAALQTAAIALLAAGASLAIEKSPAKQKADVAQARKRRLAIAGVALQATALVCAVIALAYGLTRLTLTMPAEERDPFRVEKLARVWSDPYLWYHSDLAWGWALQRDPSLAQSRPDLAAVQRAVELEPGNPVYLTDLARAKAFWGFPDAEVKQAFVAVYEVSPLSPDAHAAYAEYLLSRDDVKGAWQHLRPVEDTKSSEVWRVLEIYYTKAGNQAKVEEIRAKIKAESLAEDW